MLNYQLLKEVKKMADAKKENLELECSHCGTTSELTPVITYVHQGEEKNVCVHCLPMLIHG
jgi:hypothetical protein